MQYGTEMVGTHPHTISEIQFICHVITTMNVATTLNSEVLFNKFNGYETVCH
jgi:hypothetical protein